MVRIHDWLLLTNKSELGKSIIDQYLDRKNESLTQNAKYVSAVKSVKSSETKRVVSAYVDIEQLRNSGIAKNVYNERVDNFGVELPATLDLEQSGL